MKVKDSVLEMVGNTPLLRLRAIEERHGLKCRLYGKMEYLNVTGSIKDRAALYMLEDARKKGLIHEGSMIIEPTSGNTGIGLAALGKAMGYEVVIVMPENFSIERIRLIEAYGARVVLSPKSEGMAGAIKMADRLHEENEGSFIPMQFKNPANALAHYETTGREIYDDLDGHVDIFISAVGTGGTLTGCGRYLKEKKQDVKVIAVEPDESPLLSGGKAGPHKIQGIGANFIPELLDRSVIDEVFRVKGDDAIAMAREFNATMGALVGISSGSAIKAAVEIARRHEDKDIVVILPDSGDRYMSTELFGG